MVGFEERLNADQVDYLEAVSSFIEAYDRVRVKWPKTSPVETLKILLIQHEMSAADLARVLGSDRSLGPKSCGASAGLRWIIFASWRGTFTALSY